MGFVYIQSKTISKTMGELVMAVNYTEEQVDLMIDKYSANPTRETVEELADTLDKSIKSIIGKLSREGVYKKTEYLTKTGEKPVTKRELVDNIAEQLGVDITALAGLEKSPKTALKVLEENYAKFDKTNNA
tara:strand:- start:53 stop:445 length:393 start_codon:yes stop_codon:yes gene_type:complete